MAPKKQQKMSLNEFLGDTTLGSWADEMDALPTAPSGRADDDRGGRRGDDFLSSRPDRGDRQMFPPREDIPLPTQPPYTAFIGNLAFDLTEQDLESFFGSFQVKNVKVIKDRDERPKGFGYVEFEGLDDLKGALAQSGTSLSGRTIRVSVAEPPKERSGFGGGGFGGDDSKFAEPWRRAGPLPDLPDSRDSSRRRYDSSTGPGPREPPPPSLADNADQWRSSRRGPPPPPPESEGPPKRRGFFAGDGPSNADKEEKWTIGGKFEPSKNNEEGSRSGFGGGGFRGRGEGMGPPKEPSPVTEEKNWRSATRPPISRQSTSPNSSNPPTPQMGRRKLELLPRSGAPSGASSPLSSPKMQNATANTAHRSNPFGAAKPVDVTARENAVAERLEKDREAIKERATHAPVSRTTSRTGVERGQTPRSPPASVGGSVSVPPSPRVATAAANVRPTFSFAAAASAKRAEEAAEKASKADEGAAQKEELEVKDVTEQLGEVTI